MNLWLVIYGKIETHEDDGALWFNSDTPPLGIYTQRSHAELEITRIVDATNRFNLRRAAEGYTRIAEEDFVIVKMIADGKCRKDTEKRIRDHAWGGWMGPRGFGNDQTDILRIMP